MPSGECSQLKMAVVEGSASASLMLACTWSKGEGERVFCFHPVVFLSLLGEDWVTGAPMSWMSHMEPGRSGGVPLSR